MIQRLVLLLVLSGFGMTARADVQSLMQLVDYVGVDYAGAVADGQVIAEGEFAEMNEFGQRIESEIAQLKDTPAKAGLVAEAKALREAVAAKADPADIARRTMGLRTDLMAAYPIPLTPRKAPDLARAAQLYSENCAACHGATGLADGPAAKGMDPAPINFHERDRARQRSLFGLYNTISLGVGGTSMVGFSQLSDDDRWALAFYVGGFAREDRDTVGGAAWKQKTLSLEDAAVRSPAELGQLRSHGEELAFWLRTNAGLLFKSEHDALGFAMTTLDASIAAARAGNWSEAETLAVTAYLEGYELAEPSLRNIDQSLMRRGEAALMNYRAAVTTTRTSDAAETAYREAHAALETAQTRLAETTLSPSVSFTSSLIILLREGLEAILVLAAVFAFLSKTGQREAMVYAHVGWIGALALGAVTWAISTYAFQISGATREVTEGITALVAAGILFYVGYWMHQSSNAQAWNAYLKDKIQSALDQKSRWTIAFIAFIAVYREVFEVILFYQALWLQVPADTKASVFYGIAAAAAILAVITWLIIRYGLRLPLKQFFGISALLMIVLAIIFAGKGVVALQEAGKISTWPINGPRVDLLGIFPDAASLAAQGVLLAMALVLLLKPSRVKA